MLQDAYADEQFSDLSLRAGQFVPPFSLQRLQPDAAMPVVERALVVDALVPSAETYARDVGAQATLHLQSQWNVTIGAFNGNGGNQSANNDRQLLYIGSIHFPDSSLRQYPDPAWRIIRLPEQECDGLQENIRNDGPIFR